jgi:hypothetical protein
MWGHLQCTEQKEGVIALSLAELCRGSQGFSAEFCRKRADSGRILPERWLKAFHIKGFEALQTVYKYCLKRSFKTNNSVFSKKKSKFRELTCI